MSKGLKYKRAAFFVLIAVAFYLFGEFSRKYNWWPHRIVKDFYAIVLAAKKKHSRPAAGRWNYNKEYVYNQQLSKQQQKELSRLMVLPYLNGSAPSTDKKNVTLYNEHLVFKGLNLYLSGHKPAAFLINMKGEKLYEWHKDFSEIWEEPFSVDEPPEAKTFWRRAYLFPNGDILTMFSGYGMVKLNKESDVIWKITDRIHHDLFVAENGDIYTLVRETIDSHPNYKLDGPMLVDFIAVYDQNGVEKKRISLLEAFLKSDYASIVENYMMREGDSFHSNTVEIFDGSLAYMNPLFKKGLALVSMRNFHTIAIVDLEREKVLWALNGLWKMQHQPTLLKNGAFLLFDNQGEYGFSKVIEFDPFTQNILWAYRGNEKNHFFSRTCGSNQRLPNGNTLITESDFGRAFEVTPDNRIVWEYYNPYTYGKDKNLIATLFEMIRLEVHEIDFLPSINM
ncbi:hypothetical protein JW935_08815 [candidate division KSB1 bacterium]|nr:hypothetical protein [candidate division KSB1 bacterium]